ncbi:MAG: hypothetical protein K2N78_10815 [Oscillospiraceae bacterium]|nr:hypothetical protein [Oscillospiraceae bacterium]
MEKFLDVDVLDTLDAIAQQVMAYGWNYLSYDKEDILEAARNKSPKQSPLLWICSVASTMLCKESDTFAHNSIPYKDVQHYQSDTCQARVPAYYEIELSNEKGGIVRGNIYAINSRRYAAFVRDFIPLSATDAEVVSARESAAAELRRIRTGLPNGSLNAHLEKLSQEWIKSEAKRIALMLQKIDKPNHPYAPYHVSAISSDFLAKASGSDIDKLVTALKEELQSPSLFFGHFGKNNIPCIFQSHDEHGRNKSLLSIRERLAVKPVASVKTKTQSKDHGAR